MATQNQTPLGYTDIAPWQKKGRWYHVFLENNGEPKITDGDEKFSKSSYIENAGGSPTAYNFVFPTNFCLINSVFSPHFSLPTQSTTFYTTTINVHNRIYFKIPYEFDYADLWVFGYFE